MSIEVMGGGDIPRNTLFYSIYGNTIYYSSSTMIEFKKFSSLTLPQYTIQLSLRYVDMSSGYGVVKWRFEAPIIFFNSNQKMLYGTLYDGNFSGCQANISISSDRSSIIISNLTLNDGSTVALPSSSSSDLCELWLYGYTYQ